MFGNKKGNVAGVLTKGRAWVTELENELKITKGEVKAKEAEIATLSRERDTLSVVINEGAEVAENFKNMLGMK